MTTPALRDHQSAIASLRRASGRLSVLEILSSSALCTTRQIATFRFVTPTITQEQRITRHLTALRKMCLVRTRPTADEIEKNGSLRWFVQVHGLTELGCQAAKHYEMGAGKPFEAERS